MVLAAEACGEPLPLIGRGGRRDRGRRGRRVVDFGKERPLHVFRYGGAFLLLLQFLKFGQLGGSLFRPVGLAVDAEELKVRGGQARVQVARAFEFRGGGGQVVAEFQERAELVVDHRLIGHEARHLL